MQSQTNPPADTQAPDPSQSSGNDNSTYMTKHLDHGPLKLIPWEEIWHSLRDARIRGQGEMIEVFYETLFKEAVFDDAGAWSQEHSRPL